MFAVYYIEDRARSQLKCVAWSREETR